MHKLLAKDSSEKNRSSKGTSAKNNETSNTAVNNDRGSPSHAL